MDSNRTNILLKEYEIIHSDSSSLGSRFWTFAGIILGFSTATLAGLGYFMITTYITMNLYQQVLASILILFLSICVILMLILLHAWRKYTNNVSEFNYMRAREIELELGMWKNLRFLALRNDFYMISKEDRKRIYDYHDEQYWDIIRKTKNFFPGHRTGDWYTSKIFWIFGILWLIMAFLSIILLIISIACHFC